MGRDAAGKVHDQDVQRKQLRAPICSNQECAISPCRFAAPSPNGGVSTDRRPGRVDYKSKLKTRIHTSLTTTIGLTTANVGWVYV
jgi:hypothetical protein